MRPRSAFRTSQRAFGRLALVIAILTACDNSARRHTAERVDIPGPAWALSDSPIVVLGQTAAGQRDALFNVYAGQILPGGRLAIGNSG